MPLELPIQGAQTNQSTGQAPATPAAAGADKTPGATSRRILVVDDNVDAAETMAMFLQLLGHEVTTAHDGKAALLRAAEKRPDVVLLDIGLPHLNGYQVCAQLRRDSAPNAFIIAMTGYGQADDRQQTTQAGFNAHLVKPVNLEALQELLRTA